METEFKGTKGEWEYSSDNSWECSVVTDNDSQSVTLENTDSESDEGFYEMYHNAKLIACAPELLNSFISAIILLKQTTEFEVLESYRIKVLEFEKVLEKALT